MPLCTRGRRRRMHGDVAPATHRAAVARQPTAEFAGSAAELPSYAPRASTSNARLRHSSSWLAKALQ